VRAGRSAKAAAGNRVSGSGFPFVSGRNGAAATPRMKNEPTIVAAEADDQGAGDQRTDAGDPTGRVEAKGDGSAAHPRREQLGQPDRGPGPDPAGEKPKTVTVTSSAPID